MARRGTTRGWFAPRTPDEVQVRLDRQHGRIAELERELARVLPQVAALEERLEDLRTQVGGPGPASGSPPARSEDPGAAADVEALLQDVRRQAEQVRARVSAAARFEERLRQVEERLEGTPPPVGPPDLHRVTPSTG